MFESLTEKLESIFKKLKGKGLLKEEDVELALKEIRLALPAMGCAVAAGFLIMLAERFL